MSNKLLEKKIQNRFSELLDTYESRFYKLYLDALNEIELRYRVLFSDNDLNFAKVENEIKSINKLLDKLKKDFEILLSEVISISAELGIEAERNILEKYQSSFNKKGIRINLLKVLTGIRKEAVENTYNKEYK